MPNEPVTYDDMLVENAFHEVVNADQEMYNDTNALPTDIDDIKKEKLAYAMLIRKW